MATQTRPEFSQRQLEVIRLIASGMTNKQVARQLGMSVRTVEWHVRMAARRLPPGPPPRLRLMLYYWKHVQKLSATQ